jgi:hypothetical protein
MSLAGEDPDWVAGFCDECWWSRVAQPSLHSFSEEGKPMRLVEQSVAKDDPDPKAISCYGLYVPELKETWLRFVDARPVSAITTQFLEWCCRKLEAVGKKALVLIWDNASWHISREVKCWIGGQVLDRISQPGSQEERWRSWGEDSHLSATQEEPVAQRHRAQMDPRQTQGGRA